MLKRYALSLFLLAALCAPAISGIVNAGEKMVFGVTLMSLRHPFFQEMKGELEKIANDNGVVMRLTDADFDAGKQVRQIDDFVQQKVTAIIITPCDSKAVAPALKKAIAAGIPVVTVDVAAEGVDVISHCASDNVAGGRLDAEMLLGAFAERNVTSGTVLIVDHSGVTSTSQRVQGFKEIFDVRGKEFKVEIMNAVGQRDKAMAVTEDAIQRFGKNLVGIFGINDDCTLGALSAVERAERLDNISIVGYDFGEESKAAIDAGKIVGDTVQFPKKMGTMGFMTAYDYVTGKNTNPPKDNPVPLGTYTKVGFRDQQGNKME